MGRPKKRKRATLHVADIDLPIVPLVDVLMQLLIFFMCGTKFRSLEGKLLSYLPKDVGLGNSAVANPKLEEVRILLVYDENAPLGTRLSIKKYGQQPRPVANWQALSLEVKKYFQEIKANNLEMPFIIDPQSKIPAQSLVYALDACREAGVEDVRFAAKSPVDEGIKEKINFK